MKVNSCNCTNTSIFSFSLLLLLLISATNQKAYGQSTIYKTDGTTIKAIYLSKQGASRVYKLPDDSSGVTYYISWKAIDSIRYEDGTLEKFYSETLLTDSEPQTGNEGKNLVGFNIWPLFTRNIEVFYDRLIVKDKLGLKSSLLIKSGKNEYPDFYYNSINYSFSSGINYYFLRSDLFRFGTGAAFIYGRFNEVFYDYSDYSYYYEYYEERGHAGVFLNASFTAKFQKIIFTSFELDVPLLWNDPYTLLFKTEVAICF